MNGPLKFDQLAQALRFPPGAAASLDIGGGIIHVNRPIEMWQRLCQGSPEAFTEEADDLMQLIMHEQIHFIQMCTFGFTYSFARELYLNVLKVYVSRSPQEELPSAVRSQDAENIRRILQRMQKRGSSGLSPVDIIESLTMYQQILIRVGITDKSYHEGADFLGYNEDDYFMQLIDHFAPADEYWRAYALARQYFKEQTFRMFPLAASQALCTFSPQDSFEPICRILAKREDDLKQGNETSKTSLSDYGWIGAALEASDWKLEYAQHPIFFPNAGRICERSFKVQLRPSAEQLSKLLRSVSSTLLFYGGPDEAPVKVRIDHGEQPADEEPNPFLSGLTRHVLDMVEAS